MALSPTPLCWPYIPAYPVGFPLLFASFYSSDPFRTAPYFIVPGLSLLLAAFALACCCL